VSLNELADIGEFIGGIAVVVTLIYLALQIRQNTNAVLSNTQQSLFDNWADLSNRILEHPSVPLPQLMLKARDNREELDSEETLRFESLATRIFGMYETTFYHQQQGLLDEKFWRVYDSYYRDNLVGEGFQEFWRSHRSWFHEDFRKYVDSEVFPQEPERSG
jgi:hypothetical protein